MKVLLINGSRREAGCTFTALTEIAKVLNASDIETEIIHVGKSASNVELNALAKEVATKVPEIDGLVVGSPVYYASPSGEVVAFMDRLFGLAEMELRYKPAAAIASARRAGTTATLDVLNKYFTYAEMPVVSSRYWNMVHGSNPEDVLKDEEGIQIMQNLARNMAWMIKSIEAGKQAGVEQPTPVEKVFTSFIR